MLQVRVSDRVKEEENGIQDQGQKSWGLYD